MKEKNVFAGAGEKHMISVFQGHLSLWSQIPQMHILLKWGAW